MFKNDFIKESYSLRSIFVSGIFCSLILSGNIFSLTVWNSFVGHYHLPPIFTTTELTFTIACCFISFPLAAGLVFCLKELFQKFINSWLLVSFLGSLIFSTLLVACDYINTIIEIKNYKEPSFWASGDFGRPELPTFEELFLFVLILTMAGFVNTSLVYSLSRSFYEWLPIKKRIEHS